MNKINLDPLYLTIYISFITSMLLVLISLPISWIIHTTKIKKIKNIFEILINMPLILPPTVLGFYFIYFLNKEAFIGKLLNYILDFEIIFSVPGIIIGSIIYSLPFAVQPINIAFKSTGIEIFHLSRILQISKIKFFIKILLPLSKNGIITSFMLSFAHTIGEFGLILMIGGNIPGKTKVISIAIYESFELLNYKETHILSIIVILISFFILLIISYINN